MGPDTPVLVLGAGGFIGRNVCRGLVARGIAVHGTARPGRAPNDAGVRYASLDISPATDFASLIGDSETAIYLLSTTTPATSDIDVARDVAENLLPAVAFIEAAARSSLKRVVFVSSGGAIYGPKAPTPTSEAVEPSPITSYGIVKLAIEKYLFRAEQAGGLRFASLRVANPFGPLQTADKGQGVVAAFGARLLEHQPIEIFGDGQVRRDFVFVSDVVEAIVLAMRYDGPERVFNIGSGESRSVLEVLGALETALGVAAKIVFREGRRVDVPVVQLDIARAHAALGWSPTTSWQDGIAATAAWLRSEHGGTPRA